MRRQIVDRLFLCSVTYAVVSIALLEPVSLSYAMVKQGGWPATVGMLLLAFASTVALFDTVVNDCLPARWTLHWAMRYRQGIWLFMGILYTIHSFVIFHSDMGYLVAVFYLLYGLRCAAVSFLDLTYQYAIAAEGRLRQPTDFGVLDSA